jgi:hypothetical protein
VYQHDSPIERGAEVVVLNRFRSGLYACMTARADGLFELSDALLSHAGKVDSLPHLSLEPGFRRGHGMVYQALSEGSIDQWRASQLLLDGPVPRMRGRIVLAVDSTLWLRPEAPTSAELLFCHVYGRTREGDQQIPGWPYSFLVALEPGVGSWSKVLDVARIREGQTETSVAIAQIRLAVGSFIESGQWRPGEEPIVVVTDAGYAATAMAWALADLPVTIVSRVGSDRVYYRAADNADQPATGRKRRHAGRLPVADEAAWPVDAVHVEADSDRYGRMRIDAAPGMHQKLLRNSSGPWQEYPSASLPIIPGTVVRIRSERLPHGRKPTTPVFLWASTATLDDDLLLELSLAWLRRFDIEHLFRFLKQYLAWTTPRLRTPEAADRWTLLVVAVWTQLWLARNLIADLALPWERRQDPARLSPLRVKRGFRNIGYDLNRPAREAKPSIRGPGRPPGRLNRHRAKRWRPGISPKTAGQ